MTSVLRNLLTGLLLAWLPLLAQAEQEDESGKGGGIVLAPDKPYFYVTHDGWSVKVERIQDPGYMLRGYYAKTGRMCPPFCIQPIEVDPRVKTIAELELFSFMENELRRGTGVLIDARTPAWFKKGTIPGSVNHPFTLFTQGEKDPELLVLLQSWGAKPRKEVGIVQKLMEDWGFTDTTYLTDKWDFSNAKQLVLWCNGPMCSQSPRAIKGLLALGYPPSKLAYYRGGMQMWQLFGLTTITPKTD